MIKSKTLHFQKYVCSYSLLSMKHTNAIVRATSRGATSRRFFKHAIWSFPKHTSATTIILKAVTFSSRDARLTCRVGRRAGRDFRVYRRVPRRVLNRVAFSLVCFALYSGDIKQLGLRVWLTDWIRIDLTHGSAVLTLFLLVRLTYAHFSP